MSDEVVNLTVFALEEKVRHLTATLERERTRRIQAEDRLEELRARAREKEKRKRENAREREEREELHRQFLEHISSKGTP